MKKEMYEEVRGIIKERLSAVFLSLSCCVFVHKCMDRTLTLNGMDRFCARSLLCWSLHRLLVIIGR